MSTPTSDGGRHVIPPDELKCVWMTAGILSYQLCDRQLDCDQCPLDQAMRMYTRRGGPAAAAAIAEPPPADTDRGLRDDRRYGHEHCWVLRQPDEGAGDEIVVRVGLEPALADALLSPRAIVHTEPGGTIQHRATHFWVVTEGGTFGVRAPVDGVLLETNALLNERPHLVAMRPLDEGWLYTLRVEARSRALDRLLEAPAAAREYDAAARRFRESLRQALRSTGRAAGARDDDPTTLQALADALGPARYLALMRRVYA